MLSRKGYQYAAFLFVVLSSIATSSVFVGNTVGNILLLIAIIFYLLISNYKFHITKIGISAFSILFLWYAVIVIVFGESPENIFRLIAYASLGFVCLFVIPSEIEFNIFARVYTWLITGIVIIGLLTKLGFSFTLLGSEITTRTYAFPAYYFIGDIATVEAITSIFPNQNTLARIAFFGAVLALYLYRRSGKMYFILLIIINISGIYFSRSRAAVLTIIIVILLYGLHVSGKDWLISIISIGTVPGILTFSAVGSGLLPDPLNITSIISNRVPLWEASIQTIRDTSLIGSGPTDSGDAIERFLPPENQGSTPHNAFLAMFTTGGIIGGVSYSLLYFHAHKQQLKKLYKNLSITIVMLTVGAALLQLFSAYLLFGFTVQSVLTAFVFGYAMQYNVQEVDHK